MTSRYIFQAQLKAVSQVNANVATYEIGSTDSQHPFSKRQTS